MPENTAHEYTGTLASVIVASVAMLAEHVALRSDRPDSPVKVTLNEGGNVATVTDDQPGFSIVVTFPESFALSANNEDFADYDENEV